MCVCESICYCLCELRVLHTFIEYSNIFSFYAVSCRYSVLYLQMWGEKAADKFVAAAQTSYHIKIYCSLVVDGFGSFIDIMCVLISAGLFQASFALLFANQKEK